MTFTDNGDGTATLAGTPAAGTGGTYALTFTADNGGPTPATQSFTLTVTDACPAITVSPATMPDGLFQVAYAGVTFTRPAAPAARSPGARPGSPRA